MTLQKYVNDILQIPVTRVGNRYMIEAIEIVLDTHDHKFYPQLCKTTGKATRQLEKALRDVKEKSLIYMENSVKEQMFPNLINKSTLPNTEFVVLAAQFYKEHYEDKEER